MRVGKFLHKLLANTIHKKRISVLSEAVESALDTKNLTLTGLARGIKNNCKERSNIRKMDRLFGNKKLEQERDTIYKVVSKCLLSGVKRPVLIVDAVKLPYPKMYALRASCTFGGRTHTIYEMLHHSKEWNSKLHKVFLDNLNLIIPKQCHPIVVTDAGFHNPWFKLVLSHGWDFIGRVRGLKIYCNESSNGYNRCSSLWTKASVKAKFLGEVILNRINPLRCYFYSYKKQLKGRSASATKDNAKLDYARSVREPWLLASSLGEDFKPSQIIAMYKKRMKIEESFRDMKSERYGLGIAQYGLKKPARLGNMLLIAMLTNFIACCLGQALEMKNKHWEFQANSIRSRRVLSYFYLGCQAIRKGIEITLLEFRETWAVAGREAELPLC